jgi:Leucine-rich repeat (LRR) protein
LNTTDENRRDLLEFNIEGLSSLQSLHLGSNTSKVNFLIKNLPSLTRLSFSGRINEDIITRLLDQIPHIRELCLYGHFSYFNLDHLVNLRELSLSGTIDEKFNFELFKNLCEKLEDISIRLINIHENMLVKLFDGYNFPNLVKFAVKQFGIKRLKSVLINRFSTLRYLTIAHCDIKVIDYDSFLNFEQLCLLDLSYNRIEFIGEKTFSSLKNLKTLDLSNNNLTYIDRQFIGLGESVELKIQN